MTQKKPITKICMSYVLSFLWFLQSWPMNSSGCFILVCINIYSGVTYPGMIYVSKIWYWQQWWIMTETWSEWQCVSSSSSTWHNAWLVQTEAIKYEALYKLKSALHMPVPCRNWTLFHCIFQLCYCIRNIMAQTVLLRVGFICSLYSCIHASM